MVYAVSGQTLKFYILGNISQALLMFISSFEFSKAANQFEVLTRYRSLTYIWFTPPFA